MSATVPQDAIVVYNDSGMPIPPRSIVIVTSVEISEDTEEGTAIHHCTQYSGQAGNVFVTGPMGIPKDTRGRAFADQFLYVAIDPSAPTPNPGDEWGPMCYQWTASPEGVGFIAQGYADTGDAYPRAMFLRTFVKNPTMTCSSSSSSSSSSGSSGSSSGSSSSSAACGCITVVTSVGCSGGGLSVSYGQARGCC